MNNPAYRSAQSGYLFFLLTLRCCVCLVVSPLALAESSDAEATKRKVEQLQKQIIEIQHESQMKLEALQRQTTQQMNVLQEQVAQLSAVANQQAAQGQSIKSVQQLEAKPAGVLDRLDISGDFRLRYENNSEYADVPGWDRGVIRGRMAAKYALSDSLKIGARVVTGDSNNPRTADTTIGDFDSDLTISLDQAYVAFQHDNLFLTGGKFAKPFSSTEVVWDGDVNPQGAGGYYNLLKNESWAARFTAIYFTINPSIYEKGSDMLGGQFSLQFKPGVNWDLALHTAYYDYDIGVRKLTVSGGARGNNVTPDGLYYVSDFNLFDTMGTLAYSGFGERWNIRLVADFVKNLGAEVPQDSGYGFDLFVGNLKQPGRFLFRYGYSSVETDAVLGMFSNDNIIFPTNYELHTFSLDYALRAHTFLGLTNYIYRHLDDDPQTTGFANDWLSRTRLNLYFTF